MTLDKYRAVLGFFAGSVALALWTFATFPLRLNLAKVVRRDLIVVLLFSRLVNFLESAVVFLIGGGCLTYLFAPLIIHLTLPGKAEASE